MARRRTLDMIAHCVKPQRSVALGRRMSPTLGASRRRRAERHSLRTSYHAPTEWLCAKIRLVTLREQFAVRQHQWAAFHRRESAQPLPERDPAEILADLGAIWNWLPPEVRTEDPDPRKLGIQKMRAALAHLRV